MDPTRYYVEAATAFARGRLSLALSTDTNEALARAKEAGLKLHKFKRNAALPRVRQVLGVLRGFAPKTLLDIGSGRGTFLWPLLDALPTTRVTAIDANEHRARDLAAVARGGIERLEGRRMDATSLELEDGQFDGVTMLEVLEHLEDPASAAAEGVRVAQRFVIATVPSKPDENPEHIRVFTGDSLNELLIRAGASRCHIDYVRGHIVAVATIGEDK